MLPSGAVGNVDTAAGTAQTDEAGDRTYSQFPHKQLSCVAEKLICLTFYVLLLFSSRIQEKTEQEILWKFKMHIRHFNQKIEIKTN